MKTTFELTKKCIFCKNLKHAFIPLYLLVTRCYVFIFGRPYTQAINHVILQLALRARGYNNCCDPKTTGEAYFIDLLAKTNPKLCIDIGANKGHFSQALLNQTKCHIVAFEPLPKAFDSLINLQAQYLNRFKAYNVGVGSEVGSLELFYGAEDSELASFSKEVNQVYFVGSSNVNKMTVPVITLDSYFTENLKGKVESLDLLKIDTEGYEYEVLMGAQQTIFELKPKFIQIEFNWHQLFRGHSLLKISELIDGYSAYQMLPYGAGLVRRDLNRPESNIYHYSNFVFVRNDISLY
jgi:FkbM family methyltransferase